MSFALCLKALQNILLNDSGLQGYAQKTWRKSISVKPAFRHRQEIKFSELPLILITRPAVTDREAHENIRRAKHRVRLYAGFWQKNPHTAILEQIGFEEAIDKVLVENFDINGTAIVATVKDSVNDEGVYHPTYFTVVDMEIYHQRDLNA